MKAVDVVICPTTKSLTHTDARREASRVGVRVGTMPGITVDTMTRCLTANADDIVELTKKVAKTLKKSSEVRIVTKLGTDITVQSKGRRIIPSTGVLTNIGESGNLPSGEVFFAPREGKATGTIVFDGSIGGIGLLKKPVKITFKEGLAIRFTGGEPAKKLSKMLRDVGGDALAIGELGIGTNPNAQLCGDILEDEKVLGTVHFAFGNNLTMGGKIEVPIHIDCIVTKPTIYVDNNMIMEEGEFKLD